MVDATLDQVLAVGRRLAGRRQREALEVLVPAGATELEEAKTNNFWLAQLVGKRVPLFFNLAEGDVDEIVGNIVDPAQMQRRRPLEVTYQWTRSPRGRGTRVGTLGRRRGARPPRGPRTDTSTGSSGCG